MLQVHASDEPDSTPIISGREIWFEHGALSLGEGNEISQDPVEWTLPNGEHADNLVLKDDAGVELYCHVLRHTFAPATLGPETAFRFHGLSLCGANGRPFRFRDGGTGYFADVWAGDPELRLVFSPSPMPPASGSAENAKDG